MLLVSIEWGNLCAHPFGHGAGTRRADDRAPSGASLVARRPHRRSLPAKIHCARDAGAECDLFAGLAFVCGGTSRFRTGQCYKKGNHFLSGIASIFERHTYFQFGDLSLPLIYLILFNVVRLINA
jgi:hypothetical protein